MKHIFTPVIIILLVFLVNSGYGQPEDGNKNIISIAPLGLGYGN